MKRTIGIAGSRRIRRIVVPQSVLDDAGVAVAVGCSIGRPDIDKVAARCREIGLHKTWVLLGCVADIAAGTQRDVLVW